MAGERDNAMTYASTLVLIQYNDGAKLKFVQFKQALKKLRAKFATVL